MSAGLGGLSSADRSPDAGVRPPRTATLGWRHRSRQIPLGLRMCSQGRVHPPGDRRVAREVGKVDGHPPGFRDLPISAQFIRDRVQADNLQVAASAPTGGQVLVQHKPKRVRLDAQFLDALTPGRLLWRLSDRLVSAPGQAPQGLVAVAVSDKKHSVRVGWMNDQRFHAVSRRPDDPAVDTTDAMQQPERERWKPHAAIIGEPRTCRNTSHGIRLRLTAALGTGTDDFPPTGHNIDHVPIHGRTEQIIVSATAGGPVAVSSALG